MKDFDSLIPGWLKESVHVGTDLIRSQYLIGLLLAAGFFSTISSKSVRLRMLPEMFRALVERPETLEDGKRGTPSFQVFVTSAGSRVGIGNIAGVMIAIVLGGPGTVFRIWVIAFIDVASVSIEATLAQVYKVHDKDGGFCGGPVYYITRGLDQKWLGIVFAILITITLALVFSIMQSNTIAESLNIQYNISSVVTGITLAIVTAITISGGVRSIATLSSLIVPIMAIIHIDMVLVILLFNLDQIVPMTGMIIKSTLGIEQVTGGAVGVAVLQGAKRGLFSNEAGIGSAPNVVVTVTMPHPVKQGLIQSLGVFFGTMLVCTATAIMTLLYSGLRSGGNVPQGVAITQSALNEHPGSAGGIFLTIAAILFTFSSVVGNYYYDQSNVEFLSTNRMILFIFRCFVIILVPVGVVIKTETVWNTADLFTGLMAIVNIISTIGLSSVAFVLMKDYQKQKKEGKNPAFKPENLEINLFGTSAWGVNKYKNSDK